MEKNRICIVDEDETALQALGFTLLLGGIDYFVLSTARDVIPQLEKDIRDANVVLANIDMLHYSGYNLMEDLHFRFPCTPVILYSWQQDVQNKGTYENQGAYKFITKPLIPELLMTVLLDACKRSKEQR